MGQGQPVLRDRQRTGKNRKVVLPNLRYDKFKPIEQKSLFYDL